MLAAGEIDWSIEQFSGKWTDAIYMDAHHDEIYTDPGILWTPFRSFIETGLFPEDSSRELIVSEAIRPFVAE